MTNLPDAPLPDGPVTAGKTGLCPACGSKLEFMTYFRSVSPDAIHCPACKQRLECSFPFMMPLFYLGGLAMVVELGAIPLMLLGREWRLALMFTGILVGTLLAFECIAILLFQHFGTLRAWADPSKTASISTPPASHKPGCLTRICDAAGILGTLVFGLFLFVHLVGFPELGIYEIPLQITVSNDTGVEMDVYQFGRGARGSWIHRPDGLLRTHHRLSAHGTVQWMEEGLDASEQGFAAYVTTGPGVGSLWSTAVPASGAITIRFSASESASLPETPKLHAASFLHSHILAPGFILLCLLVLRFVRLPSSTSEILCIAAAIGCTNMVIYIYYLFRLPFP